MYIRRGIDQDMEGINKLLRQVLTVHHRGRPDLFKADAKKYRDDDSEHVMGYAFCILKRQLNDNILTDIKTLYIDDLCVDESSRGQHIGSRLYEYVLQYARREGCYNVTLNVWECNPGAKLFYEKCGLTPQKTGMEIIL